MLGVSGRAVFRIIIARDLGLVIAYWGFSYFSIGFKYCKGTRRREVA